MSDAALRRIESALDKLSSQQNEIAVRLARLEKSASASAEGPCVATREHVVAFLDQFRAGEALGETSLGAWIAVCKDARLRGGLRTVQHREGSHARLLAERIKELGAAPHFEIPDDIHTLVMQGSAATDKSDAAKVKEFVERFPDADAVLAPIHDLAAQLDDDPETQSLLRTIAQDERATLEFFYQACEQLDAG